MEAEDFMADIQEKLKEKINPTMTVSDFNLLKVIGVGSYGKVLLVKKKDSGTIYALKMLRKGYIAKRMQVEHTLTERKVMEIISHPFIIKLRYAFQNAKKLYFVLEYCPGGELFYHLSSASRFEEEKAKFYSAQIVLALKHLHENNIIYRDLKPENVLIDKTGYIKLTDFGLSKTEIKDNKSAQSFCGTPEYLAPEVLKHEGHGKAVDWWSLGAIIYEMLTGLPPFYSENKQKLFHNIKYAELKYPPFISVICENLLSQLFIKDPEKRLGAAGAEEVMEHPWFAHIEFDRLLSMEYRVPFKPSRGSGVPEKLCVEPQFLEMPPVDSCQEQSLPHLAQEDEHYAGFTFEGRKSNLLNK